MTTDLQGHDTVLSGELKDDLLTFDPDQVSCLEKPRNQFAFLMFGLGMLLPWNAMLAAMDFFEVEYPDYKP